VPVLASHSREQSVSVRAGSRWRAADVYIFDIDGTLLNSRDAVHYFAFCHAMREVLGLDATIDHVPVHGNTDPGILRAVLKKQGMAEAAIDACLPRLFAGMCAEVERNRDQLRPELCPQIPKLLEHLSGQRKVLGVASGNLEPIGWLKLEHAGLRRIFSFGSFAHPRERRSEIFIHGVEQARNIAGAAAEVCIVGDTPSDIAAAREAGVPIIALATGVYGFQSLVELEPDACFPSAAGLLAAWEGKT
jgi:phosphoglycolate phosphatase-like HAD superfamily hydrolase